jgi:hypothetical protein
MLGPRAVPTNDSRAPHRATIGPVGAITQDFLIFTAVSGSLTGQRSEAGEKRVVMSLKSCTLTALAAAALLILVSADTASAETTLCKTTESPCAAGNSYGLGTELNSSLATGTESVFTASGGFPQVKCSQSEIRTKIEQTTTPSGNNSTLWFGGCNNTVTVWLNGWSTIHHDAGHNGNVTFAGYELEIVASGLHCLYSGPVNSGMTLTGGSPATISVTASLVLKSGIFCPSSITWHAAYTVASPKPLYVSTGV